MDDITTDIKIKFVEDVVLLSFGDPSPYEVGQSRTDWIRNETNTQFSSLSDTQRQRLINLSGYLRNEEKAESKLAELKKDRKEEREYIIKQKETENEQKRLRVEEVRVKGTRKSASKYSGSDIPLIGASVVDFYTSSTSKTPNSFRSLLNQALQKLINQSGSDGVPEDEVQTIMGSFFIDAATAFGLQFTDTTEAKFAGERTFGRIDHLFYFDYDVFPLFLLEYKTTKGSAVRSGIAQTSVEVEAIFQNLRRILGEDANEFVGILTNGFEWIGVRSYIRDEQLILEHSNLINALSPHSTVDTIYDDGVNLILRLISYCFEKAKILLNTYKNIKNRNKKRIVNDDEPPVSRDDEEDPEDPEDPENKSRKRSLRKPSSSTSLKKSKGNQPSKTSGQKSNKNQETEDFGTLSEWNIIMHSRNPENVNEYRSLERFLGLEKVF